MGREGLFILLFFTLFIACDPIIPADQTGKVVKVKDGDSIVLLDKYNREIEMRLAHIDAPEYTQAFGRKSKEFLSDMIAGEMINYTIFEDRDRYGRMVVEVYLNDTINVNREMVRNGYAWHFKRYSSSWTYSKLERSARDQGLGLWADGDAVEPWEFRK